MVYGNQEETEIIVPSAVNTAGSREQGSLKLLINAAWVISLRFPVEGETGSE